MQTTFICDYCHSVFIPNDPAAARYRLQKSGILFCSKECASRHHNKLADYSSERSSWKAMRQRCTNPNHPHYARYGGRGIMCDPRWESFEQFLLDMGPKPEKSLELDRINNDGNYCKENCRWATRKEQTRNRGGNRATRLYTFNGKTMCIADWAKEIGITPASLQKRLNNNWPLEVALSPERHDGKGKTHITPNNAERKGKTIRNQNNKFITIDGVTKTYAEWEKEKGLSKGLISKRLQQGSTEYDAVMKPLSARHQHKRS